MDTNTQHISPELFLENLVKALVDYPNDVKITRTVDEMGVLLTLDINRNDMGKVIGRKGATAKAIRTLLRVVGMKHQARVNLKINEPEGGYTKPENPSFSSSENNVRPTAPAYADTSVSAEMDAALEDLKSDF